METRMSPAEIKRFATLVKPILGRFDQITWGYLRSMGYVESVGRDGIRLTEAGKIAVLGAHLEQASLLDRCKRATRDT